MFFNQFSTNASLLRALKSLPALVFACALLCSGCSGGGRLDDDKRTFVKSNGDPLPVAWHSTLQEHSGWLAMILPLPDGGALLAGTAYTQENDATRVLIRLDGSGSRTLLETPDQDTASGHEKNKHLMYQSGFNDGVLLPDGGMILVGGKKDVLPAERQGAYFETPAGQTYRFLGLPGSDSTTYGLFSVLDREGKIVKEHTIPKVVITGEKTFIPQYAYYQYSRIIPLGSGGFAVAGLFDARQGPLRQNSPRRADITLFDRQGNQSRVIPLRMHADKNLGISALALYTDTSLLVGCSLTKPDDETFFEQHFYEVSLEDGTAVEAGPPATAETYETFFNIVDGKKGELVLAGIAKEEKGGSSDYYPLLRRISGNTAHDTLYMREEVRNTLVLGMAELPDGGLFLVTGSALLALNADGTTRWMCRMKLFATACSFDKNGDLLLAGTGKEGENKVWAARIPAEALVAK